MTRIELKIPIVPIAKGRPRATRSGHTYTPTKTRHYEESIRAAWRDKYGDAAPLMGPVNLSVSFSLPRPKSMMWKTKPMHCDFHWRRPDLDNLLKAVNDALDGLAWRDDGQITTLTASKWVAAGDEQPHIYIFIEELAK